MRLAIADHIVIACDDTARDHTACVPAIFSSRRYPNPIDLHPTN
jgi:hypothetical protein